MVESTSAFPDSGAAGHGESLRDDVPWSGPAHPLKGSALHALVRRQATAADADRRLGFVPAQVH